jgi:HK97 family phage prohead protease
VPTLTLESLLRSADFQPATFDEKELTVDAVLSTGAPVARRDSKGAFKEVLDLSRLDVEGGALNGLQLLDGHKNTGARDAIGRVIKVWREGNSIVGRIRLSRASDVADIIQRIREGTLKGVSIAYYLRQIVNSVGALGERVLTGVPDIYEASLIPVPADSGATIRSKATLPHETPEETLERPAEERVETRAAIRAIARTAGLPASWADSQIDAEADVTTARAAAFEAMQTRGNVTLRTQTAAGANDDPAVILERRTAALFARVNGTAPDDASRQYFNDGLADHARAFVTMRGVSAAGMDRETLLRAAMHTTSDFPNLLTGVGSRTLMPAYQAAQSPLKALARQALHTDFRTASRLKLGEVGQLQKLSETGEIKSTSRGEAAESYALDTYGNMFALSRKALVNDDLGAFRDWGIAAGRAAAETEAALLWSLLSQSTSAGPVMGEDGVRMFHATHGNLAASGAALADTTLSAARLALRTMKGLDGKTPIAVVPKFLLVGPAKETAAEKLLTSITPTTASDVNPFAGKLTLLVEPRLSGNGWYVFSDPAALAVLEYAYLSSAQGPQIASREGWDVLGMEFRVTLDFGCGPVDWRGAYRNAGE